VEGCPESDVDFIANTTLFALWVAEALGRVVSGGAPEVSVPGWSARLLRALVRSLRNQAPRSLAPDQGQDDPAAWNLLLLVQDAVPLFFEMSKHDAEQIQELAMGRVRPSAAALREARRAFVQKVVPALNSLYASEN
jgi:hypothetical protein